MSSSADLPPASCAPERFGGGARRRQLQRAIEVNRPYLDGMFKASSLKAQ
jgi:hypothetical protein